MAPCSHSLCPAVRCCCVQVPSRCCGGCECRTASALGAGLQTLAAQQHSPCVGHTLREAAWCQLRAGSAQQLASIWPSGLAHAKLMRSVMLCPRLGACRPALCCPGKPYVSDHSTSRAATQQRGSGTVVRCCHGTSSCAARPFSSTIACGVCWAGTCLCDQGACPISSTVAGRFHQHLCCLFSGQHALVYVGTVSIVFVSHGTKVSRRNIFCCQPVSWQQQSPTGVQCVLLVACLITGVCHAHSRYTHLVICPAAAGC